MDNFRLDITSRGKENLKLALRLTQRGMVTGYSLGEASVAGRKRLVLYWAPSERAIPFPCALTIEQAAEIAAAWLDSSDYGSEPQHDGSNSKGFRLYCEAWAQIGDDWSAFAAVEPAWALHGK